MVEEHWWWCGQVHLFMFYFARQSGIKRASVGCVAHRGLCFISIGERNQTTYVKGAGTICSRHVVDIVGDRPCRAWIGKVESVDGW
jgi:hypothetical protein